MLIPTANEDDGIDAKRKKKTFVRRFGVKNVTVLHTRDRAEADTEAFVAPLKTARGVWFGGGRQWRLVDAYMGTRTQREIEAVLARGGVIGGSSAGATIQGSYLVRGAREGNQIMMAKGYEQGFGYLRGVAIDQHLLVRGRADDLVEVIDKKPELLGLGIDEPAAVVVQGDRLEVIGRSVVGIYDGKDHDGKKYYFLAPGEQFDLRLRKRVAKAPKTSGVSAATAPKPRDPAENREVRDRRLRQGARRRRVGDGAERSGTGPRSAIRRNGRRHCWPTQWRRAGSGLSEASRASPRRSSPPLARASR